MKGGNAATRARRASAPLTSVERARSARRERDSHLRWAYLADWIEHDDPELPDWETNAQRRRRRVDVNRLARDKAHEGVGDPRGDRDLPPGPPALN